MIDELIIRNKAQQVLEFFEDRAHRWNEQYSSAKSGKDVELNQNKRALTRGSFYSAVGAGSNCILDTGFYVDSSEATTGDHINPPQLMGEYFLDKLCGFYTSKDTSILDIEVVVEWIKMTYKTITVPKSINTALSYHSPYHQFAIANPKKYIPITISSKYQYLNENARGVANAKKFKGKLELLDRSGDPLTEKQKAWLFKEPEGYTEWQREKYNAIHIEKEYGKIQFMKNISTLEDFFG